MEGGGEELRSPISPFWLQSTTNYRRRVSSLFFNSGVLVIILVVIAVFSMVFIIPSILSHTSHIFRPNLVKKSWDWVNLVLVLFALAFGFLSRNMNEDRSFDGYNRTGSNISNGAPKSSPSTPHQWYDFPDQTTFNNSSTVVGGLRRHWRTSSSYPDLRELSPWVNDGNPRRFSDDTQVDSYLVLGSDHPHRQQSWQALDRQDSETKDIIHVDTSVSRPKEVSYTPPEPPQPPSQPPAPTPGFKKKAKQTYQSLARGEEKTSTEWNGDLESKKIPTEETDLPPSPPSPPRTMPAFQDLQQKISRSDRKRGGANATRDFFTSFYNKKKKKRQRQRSVDNLDTLLHQSEPPPLRFRQRRMSVDNLDTLLHHSQPPPLQFQLPPPSPPPPPPPPPPPSVFHNLFSSKTEKRKRNFSTKPAPHTPPPQAPPPPAAARAPKPTTRVASFTTHKPQVPVKMSSFSGDENSSGGESPLRRIPPPPPMPPFKMADWKFVVEGDYVRLQSSPSSHSESPDLDDVESPSPPSQSQGTTTADVSDSGDATAPPLFCPSPDVDSKADSFIAKFRAGLKLEKIHSFNQKQGLRMSNLGPGPEQGPSQL